MTKEINLTFFAGHESFYLREGWLKKSLDVVVKEPAIFQKKLLKEAINQLGVGANMVKSMRYWLELCGLIEKTKTGYGLSKIGSLIKKFDPYFQHKSSLWILHDKVAKNLPIWQFAYVEQDLPVFDRTSIHERVDSRLKELGKSFAKKTISDSISVFINTYLSDKSASDPESNIISPFSKLKLINHFDNKFSFRVIDNSDYSPFLVYFLYLIDENIEQVSQGELYAKMKGIMNVEMNSFRKSLNYLENKNLIQIDRSAGLNNIIKKKQLTEESIYKKMLKEVSI